MNRAATTRSLFRGLVLAAACHAAAQAAPPTYTIISLGTNTSGLAISPNGTYVTGYDFITGDGFVWTQAGGKQTFSPLVTTPSRPFAVANGVNDSGNAVGSIQQQSWGQQPLAAAWTGTTGAILPLPGGVTVAKGYALNSAGTMVGAINVGADWYATVYSGTGATVLSQLTTSGAILQYAYGIADTGRIVGQATGTSVSVNSAYYLDPGAPTAVDIPGSAFAIGISQNGSYITGVSGTNSYVLAPATGTSTIVPMVPGATNLETRAVNNLGHAVGYASAAGAIPFLFDGSSTYTLQSLLSGTDATQWDMISGADNAAYGISNNGIIAGKAEYNGVLSGFVMVPVPEPAAASLLAIGTALVGLSLRGRRTSATTSLLRGFVVAAACQASVQAAAPAYTIQSLGIHTSGLAVSPNGTYVTGYDFITGDGFVWTQAGGKQSFSPLVTTPSRPFALANGVNDSGNAAGSIQQQSWGQQPLPAAWTGTTGAILPLPGGVTIGEGYDLNSAGTMVGAINVGVDWYATVYSSTGATVLPQLTTSGGILQYAYGIADTGRIVGQATSTNGAVAYAFYLDPGAPTAAEIPGAGVAYGISQNGAYITGPSGTSSYVFAPATGTSTIVPMVAGATNLETRAVNDLGHAVGAAGAAGSIPFLFDGSSTYTLQSLLSGTDATQWNMVSGVDNDALGISNNGIITGIAEHNGVLSGFVMVPVPEPAAASLLAIGTALVGLSLRGRRTSR